LREDQVELALTELMRVSSHYAFSIAYWPSNILVDNQNLHPTVKSEQWWLDLISEFGSVYKWNNFIEGNWYTRRC